MLDAFKLKEFDLDPVLKSWKNPPRFLGNPKKDPSVDTWLDQVKEGCVERKIPKDYWHKVGQHFLGDKAKKRMEELKEVLRNLHGGNYRWDWKKFKTAMRNMGWDIDDKKTESVKVQTKSTGSWWIIGREKEEITEEPAEIKSTETKSTEKKPKPMRRATVGESSPTTDKSQSEKTEGEKPAAKRRATTWLNRSPSNASLTTPESSKEVVVKAEPTNSSGFWKLPFNSSSSSSSNPTPAPTTTSAAAVVPAPPVPVHAASQGEVTTTEAQAPIWLLNACNALDFLTTEHPKVMSTLSAVLITVGSLPTLPGVASVAGGAGGAILASHAVQAAGAIAVGVGHWLKSAQDSAAAKAATELPGGQAVAAAIEDASGRK